MKKIDKELCQKLTNLLGFTSYQKIGSRCCGKYKGTTDYSLVFDNKVCFFISNGMSSFSERLIEHIRDVTIFQNHKEEMFQAVCRQVEQDNLTARKEGLLAVKCLSLEICKTSTIYFLWPYIRMEVGGQQFDFIETGFTMAIFRNELEKHFQWANARDTFTAGAVEKPSFIFQNVRFSHLDGLHKIKYF